MVERYFIGGSLDGQFLRVHPRNYEYRSITDTHSVEMYRALHVRGFDKQGQPTIDDWVFYRTPDFFNDALALFSMVDAPQWTEKT